MIRIDLKSKNHSLTAPKNHQHNKQHKTFIDHYLRGKKISSSNCPLITLSSTIIPARYGPCRKRGGWGVDEAKAFSKTTIFIAIKIPVSFYCIVWTKIYTFIKIWEPRFLFLLINKFLLQRQQRQQQQHPSPMDTLPFNKAPGSSDWTKVCCNHVLLLSLSRSLDCTAETHYK